jgi:hypothetical protein
MFNRIQPDVRSAFHEDPDEKLQRGSRYVFGILLVISILVCWLSQQVARFFSVSIPIEVSLIFHGFYIVIVLFLIPIFLRITNQNSEYGGD